MSYAAAAALQTAIFQHLIAEPELQGVAIHDALPPSPAGTFVLLGPEDVREAGDKTSGGAEHRLTLSVISDSAGFLVAKELAEKVSTTLEDATFDMSRGRLVSIYFQRAVARRLGEGAVRRIDMTFRARVEL